MNTNIATTKGQSDRLLRCGVPADTADMSIRTITEPMIKDIAEWETPLLLTMPYSSAKDIYRGDYNEPAWSLSALLGLLPFKIHSVRYEYWLDIAPMDYGKQWSIGYYCMEKPRVIKGLTHTDSLIECAVQEIEFLTSNGYKLNDIKKIGSEHGED